MTPARALAADSPAPVPQPLDQPEPAIDGTVIAARVARYDKRVDHQRIPAPKAQAARPQAGTPRWSRARGAL